MHVPLPNHPRLISDEPLSILHTPTGPFLPPTPFSMPQYGLQRTQTAIHKLRGAPLSSSDKKLVHQILAVQQEELQSLQTRLSDASQSFITISNRVRTLKSDRDASVHEVLSAQATFHAADSLCNGIRQRIDEVKTSIQESKGLLHPIRDLPLELLRLIMEFRVEMEEQERIEESLYGRTDESSPADLHPTGLILPLRRPTIDWSHTHFPTPLALSLVSSLWQRVAYSTPSLWRVLVTDLRGQPNTGSSSWARIRRFLYMARHRPSPTTGDNLFLKPCTQQHGLELTFTGWQEHATPRHRDTLEKIMRIITNFKESEVEGVGDSSTSSMDLLDPGAGDPSHSRRSSFGQGDLLGAGDPSAIVSDPMPTSRSSTSTKHLFRIKRLEMSFDILCEHDSIEGVHLQQRRWNYPNPEVVVLIANPSTYERPAHAHFAEAQRRTDRLIIPPYAPSLIPCARDVTLCNLTYDWSKKIPRVGAYESIRALRLLYNRSFPELITPTSHEDDQRPPWLQFFKVAQNLEELEIRLGTHPGSHPSTSPTTTSPLATATALPVPTGNPLSVTGNNGAATNPPQPQIHTALAHLTITLADVAQFAAVLCPTLGPSAQPIHLPSLMQLTFLLDLSNDSPILWSSGASGVNNLIQNTQANITHLELQPDHAISPTGLPEAHRPFSPTSKGKGKSIDSKSLLIWLKEFDACEVLEVWGEVIANSILDVLISDAKRRMVSAPTPSPISPAIPVPVVSEPATSPAPSDPSAIGSSSNPSPTHNSEARTSLSGARRSKRLSKTPSANSSDKAQRRGSLKPFKRVKDIIATVVASSSSSSKSKRRSLALVVTPEGTPQMPKSALPAPDPAGLDMPMTFDRSYGSSAAASSNSDAGASTRPASRGSAVPVGPATHLAPPSSYLAPPAPNSHVSRGSCDYGSTSTSVTPSISANYSPAFTTTTLAPPELLPSLKKLIIHDASSVPPLVSELVQLRGGFIWQPSFNVDIDFDMEDDTSRGGLEIRLEGGVIIDKPAWSELGSPQAGP